MEKKKRKPVSRRESPPPPLPPPPQKPYLDDDDDEHEAVEELVIEEKQVSEEGEVEEEEDDDDNYERSVKPKGETEQGGEDQHFNKDAIRQLLQPFGKDQLIDFLKEAAARNPSLATRLADAAESDPAHRKIFVHGLSWDATSDTLVAAFKPYGPIQDCNVVSDKATGRSKGYGFVLFRSRADAIKALEEPQKKIGNRMTACQLASSGPVPSHPVAEATGRKIYVRNVGTNVSPEKLRDFFAEFGEIEEGPLGGDRATGKLRGFAIFVYKTEEGCKKALEEPNKDFQGCQLHCQRALDGLRGNGKKAVAAAAPVSSVMGGPSVAGILQPNDVALAYASASMMGLNAAGLIGQGLNPFFMGQPAAAMGIWNPMALGVSPAFAAATGGFSPALNPGLVTFGNGMQSGINGIAGYGSQAGLQAWGTSQGVQSSGRTASKSKSLSSGSGSAGCLPSYTER